MKVSLWFVLEYIDVESTPDDSASTSSDNRDPGRTEEVDTSSSLNGELALSSDDESTESADNSRIGAEDSSTEEDEESYGNGSRDVRDGAAEDDDESDSNLTPRALISQLRKKKCRVQEMEKMLKKVEEAQGRIDAKKRLRKADYSILLKSRGVELPTDGRVNEYEELWIESMNLRMIWEPLQWTNEEEQRLNSLLQNN